MQFPNLKGCLVFASVRLTPNAAPQPLPEAGARDERTLEAVGWQAFVRQGLCIMCTFPRCALHAYWITSSALEQERRGDRDPERLGGLQVDDQLELRGLLHGQVRGFGALQDA